MTTPSTPGRRITRVVAADGVTYGAAQRASEWGRAACPLVPRQYREAYGTIELPLRLPGQPDLSPVTVANLGAEIWERLEVDEFAPADRQQLRDWIGRLPCPDVQDTIPAGLPLSWVVALPLEWRARKAVLCVVQQNGSDGPLEVSPSATELLALPGVGSLTISDLLCVIEGAEQGSGDNLAERRVADTAPQLPVEAATLLCDFAVWALAETTGGTLGSAVKSAISDACDGEEWQALAGLRLDAIANQTAHPYTVFDAWSEGLNDRNRSIFSTRIARPDNPRTLQDIGDEYGVSRERIRQLEGVLLKKLTAFIDSEAGNPIRWRVNTLRARISVASPDRYIETLLAPPSEPSGDYRFLLLEFAGPYEVSDRWLIRQSAKEDDPTPAIREMTDEVGRIDRSRAAEALHAWGLDSSLHESFMARDQKLCNIHGLLVRWDGSLGDKLVFLLDELGEPTSAENLLELLKEDRAVVSVKTALYQDGRFVRSNRTEWAMASWGLPEYSSISSMVGKIIERSEYPVHIEEIVDKICVDFDVAESSVRAYCRAAMFVVDDGWIRLRRDHEPFVYEKADVESTSGIYALGDGRVGLLYEVDHDVLRGSGRQLTYAAGAILGINVNDRLRFTGQADAAVTVTFPGSSFHGPSLGSTRALAAAANAKSGDMLTVVLDLAEMTATATATDVTEHQPGWALVARLTGIDENDGVEGLAGALHCGRGEVRATLRSRGDLVVLDALPPQS